MIESSWRIRGWVQVVMAAMAMVATLPGRTHGLGLVTEPILKELNLDRIQFANINLCATLLGALFCFPAGQALDRYGSRVTLTAVLLALGGTVWWLSGVTTVVSLIVLITLTRGLGQSALSVVSISMVGKWFDRRLGPATAVYTVLLTLGFMVAFRVVGSVILTQGWRAAWSDIGLALAGLAALSWLLVRHQPESSVTPANAGAESIADGFELREALRTPAFWMFAGATSLFGLVSSGLSLFNQAILAERGFDAATYYNTLILTTFVGLGGQVLCGALAQRWSYQRVLSLALCIYAVALLGLTRVATLGELRLCASLLGLAGGMITVIFFAIWARAFGRRELGRIQGAAQMTTVFASAAGPLVFAHCHERFDHSYSPALCGLSAAVIALAFLAYWTPLPTIAEHADAVAIA